MFHMGALLKMDGGSSNEETILQFFFNAYRGTI